MAELGQIVQKIRSKNAGPFWLTIDIFCGSPDVFARVSNGLGTGQITALFQTSQDQIKRFDIPGLWVVKFSLKRPEIQGSISDRDMHGASWAALVSEMEFVD